MKVLRGVVMILTGVAAGAAVFYASETPLEWGRVFLALALAIAGIFVIALTGEGVK